MRARLTLDAGPLSAGARQPTALEQAAPAERGMVAAAPWYTRTRVWRPRSRSTTGGDSLVLRQARSLALVR